MMPRRLAAALFACVLVLTGCGEFSGLYNAPLPGGADLGDHPYRVTVQFSDVLDLVPQASVKVNDVSVGRVERVWLASDTKSAYVRVALNGQVELPANAVAELRQSSLLGEKFVDLRPPPDAEPEGKLDDGDRIPLARTNRHAELEEVFGALSLVLSGGGVEQLRTISRELNDALRGNEAEIKSLLSRVEHLTGQLDGHRGQITRAIDGLDRLSSTLVAEERNLETALDDLSPGIRVVADQRDQIVGMLEALQELSDVSVETIGKSRKQLVANLRALEPTIRKLAQAGRHLPEALKILPTYPIPWNAGNTMKGDFANVDAEFDMNLDQLVANMQNSGQQQVEIPDDVQRPQQGSGPPELPLADQLPQLPAGDVGDLEMPSTGGGALLGQLLGGGRR